MNGPAATSQTTAFSSRVTNGPTNNGAPNNERPVTFWGILDAFRRRWIPTLAVAIPAALLVGGLLWQMIPAEYESSALLKIGQYQQVLKETQEKIADFLTYRDSQINFLQSRPVLTSAMRVEGIRETRLMRGKEFPVEWLMEKLEVDTDYSPEFIRITLAGEHPEDLAAVVNAVKDMYLDEVVYNERNEAVKTLNSLKSKFKTLDKNVRGNEDRIDRLAEELGTGDSKVAIVNQGLMQQQLQKLQGDLADIDADIREEEATVAYLREQGLDPEQIRRAAGNLRLGATPGSPLAPSMPSDPTAAMKQQLLKLQYKIRQFKETLRNPNHPELLAMQNQESQLRKMISGSTQDRGPEGSSGIAMSKLDWLVKQREQLEAKVKSTHERLDLMGQRVVELEREKKDIEYLVKTRDEMAQDIQDREIQLDAPQRVSVVQDANVPEKRNVKARTQAAFLGGFGTLFSIIAAFTMFEWFSHRVGSTSDIANAVNLRLIGAIPSPDKGGLLGLGVFAGKVDYDEWNRAVIESMDVVRTYLMRHIDPSRSASILVTSASANEGKTTVSCQLAASLARSGKRVAIVDCDFRRPSAHLMMDAAEGPGICEFLRGEASLKEICQQTQADGLNFIPAGQIDQDVLQKLSADGGRSLIDLLKAEFDFVVIDTSPLLFVAEPSMLAQNADIVLLSTRKDYSRIPYVAQSRDSLRSLQVPLLGAVMVGSDSDFQRQTYGYRQDINRTTQHRSMVNS